MEINKKNKFYIVFNLIAIILSFIFVYNYLKYDVLIGHCKTQVYFDWYIMFGFGRFISQFCAILFYQIIPKFSTLNIFDIQITYVAFFKSFVVLLITYLYTKLFFIDSKNNKQPILNKGFSITFIIILLLLFNNYHGLISFFMDIRDSAVFFDYSMNLIFYTYFIYIIIKTFIYNKLPINKNYYTFYLICVFLCSISNEFYSISSFLINILFLLYSTKYNVDKKVKNFSFHISIVQITGIIFYFLLSGYKSLHTIAGTGYSINWEEQIQCITENFYPFLTSFYHNIIHPYILIYILIIMSFITLRIINKNINFFLIPFLIQVSIFLIDFILLFTGKTYTTDNLFFTEHEPIIYTNIQLLILNLTILLGFIFNNFKNTVSLPKKIIIYTIIFYLLFANMSFFINDNYIKNYIEDIKYIKQLRILDYKCAKIIKLSKTYYIDSIILPFHLYDQGLYLAIPPEENMDDIFNSEQEIETSRLFTNISNNFDIIKSDNSLFSIINTCYKTNINAIIFAPDKYVNQNIYPNNINFSKKELNKLKISDIENKPLSIQDINKLIEKYPSKYNLYLARAGYYKKNRDINSAIENYNQAITEENKSNNNYCISYLERGLFFYENNMPKEAEKDLSIVASRHPQSLLLKEFLANLMIQNQHYESALKQYNDLIKLVPLGNKNIHHKYKDYYFKRAELKEKYLNDKIGAKKDYEMSEEINKIYNE